MWMCLEYANIWHTREGGIARRFVVRRRQPQTWSVKDSNTYINPVIYTEEHFHNLSVYTGMQTGTFCAFHSPSSRRTEFCYESVGTDLLCCNISVCLLFRENVCRECDETVLWFSTPVLNITVTVYKHFENAFAGFWGGGGCRQQTLWMLVLLFLLNTFSLENLPEHFRIDRLSWRSCFSPLYTGSFHYEEHCTVSCRTLLG
jgi:hypothetical protein